MSDDGGIQYHQQKGQQEEQEMKKNNFEILASINVAEHIEKKNGLSYLSWAWAVDQLLRADPNANWVYNEPAMFGETMMVSCTVTAFDKSMTMQLPVMDYRNKAIQNPDAFAVNTAMMRCLVKAIALHGLGLYIYAGEDLPLSDDQPKKQESSKPVSQSVFDNMPKEEQEFLMQIAEETRAVIEKEGMIEALAFLRSKKLDADEQVAINSLFDSKERSAMKKAAAEQKAQ